MTRVICAPPQILPTNLPASSVHFAMFSSSGRPDVGTIATGFLEDLDRQGICPDVASWDFAVFALAASAADLAIQRNDSADGWTRMIELEVALFDPQPFRDRAGQLENLLRFLTGDFWQLNFVSHGIAPPQSTVPKTFDADCVSLLSGGADSLVGGIDLTASGRRPILVSQMAKGDSETQRTYSKELGAADRHLQWNHNTRVTTDTERSTRGRSIVFFAFAAVAASTMGAKAGQTVEIFVPENGFISLNIPLNPGRMGSFSTKTTHPIFLGGLQQFWNDVGIPAVLRRPYAYLTKGELMAGCQDQPALRRLVGRSTSCGRFGYYNYTHCGRCVPCLVRRASFLASGLPDTTAKYHFPDLRVAGRSAGANDIGAVASAFLKYSNQGVRQLTAGPLSFAGPGERPQYEGVISRGMDELGALLRSEGVI